MSSTASGQIEEVRNREEFWEVVGLLLADGTVRKSNHFEIIFAGKEEALIERYKKCIESLFGDVHFSERIDKHQVKIVRVFQKNVVNVFLQFLPQWKRKGNTILQFPSITNLPENLLKSFLRGFFSAEGSVILGCKWHKLKKLWIINKRVQASSKNDSLKNFVAEMLRKLGFHPAVWKNEVVLTRKEDILRFSKEIRFIDGVKISRKSRRWNGVEKNVILDIVAKLCEEGKNSFRSFEEWENFCKTCLLEASGTGVHWLKGDASWVQNVVTACEALPKDVASC